MILLDLVGFFFFFTYLGSQLGCPDSASYVFSSSRQSWSYSHGESKGARAKPNCTEEQVRMNECFPSLCLLPLANISLAKVEGDYKVAEQSGVNSGKLFKFINAIKLINSINDFLLHFV